MCVSSVGVNVGYYNPYAEYREKWRAGSLLGVVFGTLGPLRIFSGFLSSVFGRGLAGSGRGLTSLSSSFLAVLASLLACHDIEAVCSDWRSLVQVRMRQ